MAGKYKILFSISFSLNYLAVILLLNFFNSNKTVWPATMFCLKQPSPVNSYAAEMQWTWSPPSSWLPDHIAIERPLVRSDGGVYFLGSYLPGQWPNIPVSTMVALLK
jgi:hypothetical protein